MMLPKFNPSAIKLGFIDIRWYSLAYIFGIFLVAKTIEIYNKKYNLKFFEKSYQNLFIEDFYFYIILGIIFGGRVGYCLFYNISFFLYHPLEILKIWNGGMSFHGAFIGIILSLRKISKKHNISLLSITDVSLSNLPIALFFGRIANFINLELYGRLTSARWAMIFPYSDELPRHPSQLYEAFFEGILLYIIMLFITKKYKFEKKGLNTSIFLIFYAIFRIYIEFFREPDVQIGFLFNIFTMGQLLSLPILLLGIWLFGRVVKNKF